MDTIKLLELSRQGDKAARDRLVNDNTPLVYSVVRRFMSWGYDINDLFQIGVIGLIKAIDKFDFAYDVRFSTYAVPMISGEVKRFLRDDGLIRISRSIKDNMRLINKANEDFVKEHGYEPDLGELSKCTGISKEDILIALEARRPIESMESYVGGDNTISLAEVVPDKTDSVQGLVDKMTVKTLLEELPPTERQLMELRYFSQYTQSQIASVMGMSQVQVSRLEKKILLKLRRSLV